MSSDYMQQELFLQHQDYSTHKVLLGLSGGINSMAVLVWMASSPEGLKPKELHLVYHHFKEHSPDTFQFVADGIRYARKHFSNVKVVITKNSIIEYFKKSNMIPHPAISPCSRKLKIEPSFDYMLKNDISINVVGYVKGELRRVKRMAKRTNSKVSDLIDQGVEIRFPISSFNDDWCFKVVDKYIGWHPAIYDIKNDDGERVFTHNNCLPCKNMETQQFNDVKKYYPKYHQEAMKLSALLSAHWGRSEAEFYSTFGRDLGQESTCEACEF